MDEPTPPVADECPEHGPRIAENPDGYRYCAWCGWEPATGVIPANPTAAELMS